MSDSLIDHEAIRKNVEKRLEPRLRLLRQRVWLFAHVLVFGTVMALIYSNQSNSIFFFTESYTVPAQSFPGVPGSQPINIPEQTYQLLHPYGLVTLLSWAWLVLVIIHCLYYASAFARERTIQREMEREMELEKLRLQLELAQISGTDNLERKPEKPKRVARLDDDGEMLLEDEAVRRSNNHRRSQSG